MRTIGVLVVALILWPSSPLREMEGNKNISSPDLKKQTAFRFHPLVDPCSSLLVDTRKKADIDTNTLKQSDWYANVIKNIEESEYEIESGANDQFKSSNLRQNLRTSYTSDKFILEPGEKDKWKLQLTLKGVYSEKKKIYSPGKDATAVIGKNKIQFNHNNKFAVEYINSKEGVRQNFIIQREPASKPQTLNIKLSTNKGWFINKVHPKEIHFAKTNSNGSLQNKLIYNDLKVWDADNKELDASFSINKNEISINVNVADAVYPITIDPLSTTPSTTLNGVTSGDYFGNSVASAGDINGDGYSDVIVGAPGLSTNRGKIYLFQGSATGLSTSPATTIVDINSVVNDHFGYSVASAGDVNGDGYSDVIVGAYGVSSSRGAAYVFLGSGGGLTTSPATTLSGANPFDEFGWSVAGAGDVNGDGKSDVIVGAWDYNPFQGAAYLYLGNAGGVNSVATSILTGTFVEDRFGWSVASAGDVNGDGYSDIIVGLWGTGPSSSQGKADVFLSNGTGLSSSPIVLSGLSGGDEFGYSVACAGDVNGDGYSDVIVGAPGVSSSRGAAYLFLGSSGGTNPIAATTINGVSTGDSFGISVACAGDINSDGYSDVIVGAQIVGPSSTGAVYLFLGSSTGIPSSPSTTISGLSASSSFGNSVASAGDVNGDGYSDIIVGAPNLTLNTGAAYVYEGSAAKISVSASTTWTGFNSEDWFGWSVACAGDVNGDGYSDVIVGAYETDDPGQGYLFLGSATGLPSFASDTLVGVNTDDHFGTSVASAGDVNGDGYSDIVIGAPHANSLDGAAYIYLGGPGIFSTIPATTLAGETNSQSEFGISVATAGDTNGDGYGDLIIGASFYNSYRGRAYLYRGSPSGISNPPTIILDDVNNVDNDNFGTSVAGAGDVNGDGLSDVIIGAYGVSNVTGAAYIYYGSPSGLSAPDSLNGVTPGDYFGISVAGAGDINGDGYNDVIIGALGVSGYTGAAYIYLGGAGGLSTTAADTINDPQPQPDDDFFGNSVASAGDVNGDGYSDVIIGAYGVSGYTGAAYLYLGGSGVFSASPATTLNGIDSTDVFGFSVAGAGDINGDGYSDLIAGAPGADSSTGNAYFFYGDSAGGYRNNLRLYNSDLVTPIQQSNMSDPDLFGAGLYAKSFIGGKQKGKMVWETVWNGQPFSGNPITNSVNVTSSQPAFLNLDLTGTELKQRIAKQTGHKATYIRARVKYDPVTAITGQVYGPWRYPESFLRGKRDIGAVALPVKFISFTAVKQDKYALLKWITTDEEPGVKFEVQHSTDGINFTTLTIINGRNQTQNEYEWLHSNPARGNNFYRIRAVEIQKEAYTATRKLFFNDITSISIYPNPAIIDQLLTIKNAAIVANQRITISLINSRGQLVWKKEIVATRDGSAVLNIPDIPGGAYLLLTEAGHWTGKEKIIVVNR